MATEYTEDQLYDLSDEELDAAFREAKAERDKLEKGDNIQEENVEETVEEEQEEETGTDEEIIDEETDTNLEHPEEDSNELNDTEETVKEVEENSKTSPEDSDQNAEDKPVKENEKTKTEETVLKYKIKANGQELELTNEELIKLAPKALDYTKKMQEIAPWRRTISALKDNNMSGADVNLMISALNGDKDAVTEIVKRSGVDTLDIDTETEEPYTVREYGKSEQQLALEDVVNTISVDPEYVKTQRIVNNDWDRKSQDELVNNPQMIEALHYDVKAGIFDKVSPIALKYKALDNGRRSDIEYYKMAGKEYYENLYAQEAKANQTNTANNQILRDQEAVKAAKAAEAKRAKISKAAASRKAAAPTKKAAGKLDVVDFLDDNDEEFEAWYKRLQESQ